MLLQTTDVCVWGGVRHAVESHRCLCCCFAITQHLRTPYGSRCAPRFAPPSAVPLLSLSELMVNVTKHELVPKHEPLSEAEKKEFLKAQCVP